METEQLVRLNSRVAALEALMLASVSPKILHEFFADDGPRPSELRTQVIKLMKAKRIAKLFRRAIIKPVDIGIWLGDGVEVRRPHGLETLYVNLPPDDCVLYSEIKYRVDKLRRCGIDIDF